MAKPKQAVTRKFAEVLIKETRVVDECAVRARVKRAHMMALDRRLRRKKIPRNRGLRKASENAV